jgi:hypothetical protein
VLDFRKIKGCWMEALEILNLGWKERFGRTPQDEEAWYRGMSESPGEVNGLVSDN